MGWVVVPNLLEGRDQLNARFPNRDKGAEGTIGDTSHQASASSHNPDLTGNPEYRDGDSVDEVRAWDADKDLNDPVVTMEQVVQHLLAGARSGKFWWIRYIIFNGRIWHRRDGFVTRTYTGSNKHTDHAHINSDFTQQADTVTGTNWEFNTLGGSTPAPAPAPAPKPSVRNLELGVKGDDVRHLQQVLHDVFPIYRKYVSVKRGQLISVDGDFGPQTKAWVQEFQRRTGLVRDGVVGPNTRAKLKQYGY